MIQVQPAVFAQEVLIQRNAGLKISCIVYAGQQVNQRVELVVYRSAHDIPSIYAQDAARLTKAAALFSR